MKAMKVGPRTILTDGGKPVAVALVMRKASSAPARVKCALVMPMATENGEQDIVPLPFAVAVMPDGKGKPGRGWTPEFRIELN